MTGYHLSSFLVATCRPIDQTCSIKDFLGDGHLDLLQAQIDGICQYFFAFLLIEWQKIGVLSWLTNTR